MCRDDMQKRPSVEVLYVYIYIGTGTSLCEPRGLTKRRMKSWRHLRSCQAPSLVRIHYVCIFSNRVAWMAIFTYHPIKVNASQNSCEIEQDDCQETRRGVSFCGLLIASTYTIFAFQKAKPLPAQPILTLFRQFL